MTVEVKQSKQIFPDFPREKIFSNKDGSVSSVWHHSLTQLYQALQRNFSNEGLQLPQLSITQINDLQAIYEPLVQKNLPFPPKVRNINGTKVFDYTNSLEKTFIITFVVPGDATSGLQSAQWKTVTLT